MKIKFKPTFGKVLLTITVLWFVLTIMAVKSCSDKIEAAGGVKQLIIETGRELKNISDEINKD